VVSPYAQYGNVNIRVLSNQTSIKRSPIGKGYFDTLSMRYKMGISQNLSI